MIYYILILVSTTGVACLITSAIAGARGRDLQRQALASTVGLAAMFATFAATIVLQGYNRTESFGLSVQIMQISLPVGSLIGASLCSALIAPPNRPAAFSFVSIGAVLTFGVVSLVAMASQGAMDSIWMAQPIWHILVSLLTFYLCGKVSRTKIRFAIPAIAIVAYFTTVVVLRFLSDNVVRASYERAVNSTMEATERRRLPLVPTSPPKVQWSALTFTPNGFTVSGLLEGNRGNIMASGDYGNFFVLYLKTHSHFKFGHDPEFALTALEAKDAQKRAQSWLMASGISQNVSQHLFGLITKGQWDSQIIVPGPIPKGLEANKKYRINISIRPVRGKVGLTYSDAPVLWDAFGPEFQQPNTEGSN